MYAQDYSRLHYDVKDGLPSTTVYDVTQDIYGFIWFATENGASRFDGTKFQNFTTTDGLPDNAILEIGADNNGRVFFSPFTHTPYYYLKNTINKLKVNPHDGPELSNSIQYHKWGQNMLIRASTLNFIVDAKGNITTLNSLYKNIPENAPITWVKDSVLIIHHNDSLFILGRDKNTYVGRNNPLKPIINFNQQGSPIFANQLFTKPLNPGGMLSDNFFYATLDNTIFLFSSITGELMFKIAAEKPSSVFIDTENNLWITTLGNGVFRIPSFEFRHMNFANSDEIFSINTFDNKIICGTDFSKIYKLDKKNTPVTFATSNYSPFIPGSTNPITLSSKRNRIYKLLRSKAALYIGTDAFLLKESKSSKPIFKNIYPIKDIDTLKDELLLCTGSHVFLMNASDLSVKDTLLKQRSTSGAFYQGNFYIGTLGGLVKINSGNKSIQSLGYLHPALKNRIVSIQRGINNDLWVATSGAGLIRLINEKVKTVFTTASGITSDICTSLYIDSADIWLGTNKGLNRIIIHPDSTRVTTFTTANGLSADFVSSLFIHENTVYVGSPNGLTYFNKYTTETKSICVLHIIQVSEGSKQLGLDSLYTFPHNALNIKIDFTAISFKSAGDNKYFYQLVGLDTGWNLTNNTFINYATLPPGNYWLKIKAINKFGVESESKVIAINIIPPWWQTWLFRMVVSLLTAAIVYFIYWLNIRSIRKREENKRVMEAKFAALEQQALQAQMNPHFIFNCLNSIQSFIIDLDVEGANKYLSVFASMIRQTLENSSHLLIPLSNELKYLDTYLQLEKLRFKDKFNYFIEIDEEIDQQNTLIPGMLLQPYIENSLRHGIQHRKDNEGLISLHITSDNHKGLACTIKDNGVGRKKSGEMKSVQHIEYQSRGTVINEKRIIAINNQFNTHIRVLTEDILNADGSVGGTLVKLFIPSFPKTI